jgi:hypothetical protein
VRPELAEETVDVADVEVDVLQGADAADVLRLRQRRADQPLDGQLHRAVMRGASRGATLGDAVPEPDHRQFELVDAPNVRRPRTHACIVPGPNPAGVSTR